MSTERWREGWLESTTAVDRLAGVANREGPTLLVFVADWVALEGVLVTGLLGLRCISSTWDSELSITVIGRAVQTGGEDRIIGSTCKPSPDS